MPGPLWGGGRGAGRPSVAAAVRPGVCPGPVVGRRPMDGGARAARRGPWPWLPYPRREMTPPNAHRSVVLVLSAFMIVIGTALLVQAFTGVGSVLSARTILGVLFLAAGVGRIYVEWRRGGEG